MTSRLLLLLALAASALAADAPKRKILFFTKSSGFEHDVISYKKGMPSFAEKQLSELGKENNWEFVFSKDGAKFSPEYLAQFDTVMFYTTGDLCSPGTDKNPPMSLAGKQALFDFVKAGKGFVGTHSAADTFHTDNESQKGPERFKNHGDKADSYVCFLGAEFIRHGKQQAGVNKVVDPTFPGFAKLGDSFSFVEEWYTLKDFRPEIHVLTTFNEPALEGKTISVRPSQIAGHATKARAASSIPPWATAKTFGPIRPFGRFWSAASLGLTAMRRRPICLLTS